MLLAVKEQFEPQLRDQGTKLRWMWMNVQVERRVSRAFGPPALPSALVLKPHKRPRFALAKHEEKDGDALPIKQDAIVNLLNQVLGGDARFTTLPAQKLQHWAERGGATGAAAEGASKKVEAATAKSGVPRQEAPKGARTSLYEKLAYGAVGCPPGTEIDSVKECEHALKSLGINTEPRWVSVYPGLPKGCSVREAVDAEHNERLHFNSAPTGQGRKDLAPVCKAPPAATSGPAEPALPELAGKSHRQLFGSDGLSFIYLRKGPITREETRMLLALEEQFQPQAKQRGLRMTWMWMDVRVERKLAGSFDPEILPSAVVLDPHGKPRFTLMKHEEREGEPLAADEASLKLLLDTVLSGDADFKSLPAQRLAVWADGTTS